MFPAPTLILHFQPSDWRTVSRFHVSGLDTLLLLLLLLLELFFFCLISKYSNVENLSIVYIALCQKIDDFSLILILRSLNSYKSKAIFQSTEANNHKAIFLVL